jgi:hypothetical protein
LGKPSLLLVYHRKIKDKYVGVCVCAQHVRGQTWTARKFVFFAGYHPIKYGLLANIIGTLTIKKISMGLHFA